MPQFSEFGAFIRRRLLRRRWRVPRVVRRMAAAAVAAAAAALPAETEVVEAPRQAELVLSLDHVCELLRMVPPLPTQGSQPAEDDTAVRNAVVSDNDRAEDDASEGAVVKNAPANDDTTDGTKPAASTDNGTNETAAGNAATGTTTTRDAATNTNSPVADAALHGAAIERTAIRYTIPGSQSPLPGAALRKIPRATHSRRPTRSALPMIPGGRLLTKIETIVQRIDYAARTARIAQLAPDIAELSGVAEAFAMGVDYLERNDLYDATVLIFCDSQRGIGTIREGIHADWYTGRYIHDILRPILIRLNQLSERLEQRRSKVQIHWVKRATNFYNKAADDLAREGRLEEDIPYAERSDITRDLDEEVERAVERFKERQEEIRKKKASVWDHDKFTKELVGRVLELRRMKAIPESWSPELELELRKKENLISRNSNLAK
ncbi:hypothetical protein V8F20_006367 [Naviculisporaceae sp. PSN 640]